MGGPGSERAGLARLGKRRAQGAARPRPGRGGRGCHRHAHRSARRHGSRLQRDPRHLRRGRPAPETRSKTSASPTPAPASASSRSPSTKTSRKADIPRRRRAHAARGNHRCFRRPGVLPSLPAPFVVKPPREGSSVGVHIVQDAGGCRRRAWRMPRNMATTSSSRNSSKARNSPSAFSTTRRLPIVHIAPPRRRL